MQYLSLLPFSSQKVSACLLWVRLYPLFTRRREEAVQNGNNSTKNTEDTCSSNGNNGPAHSEGTHVWTS